MVMSCFFCQNLLSDYLDDLLPSGRQLEVKEHLNTCDVCQSLSKDLRQCRGILDQLESPPMAQDMTLRLSQVTDLKTPLRLKRWGTSRVVLGMLVPVLLFATVVMMFPAVFPWATRLRVAATQNASFERYFPLVQGADQIIEDQTSWLYSRGSFTRSVWEEGGLSPDEFEKAFQIKGGVDKDLSP